MDNITREEFVKKYLNSHSENSEDRLNMVLSTCNESPFLYRYRPMKEYDFKALEENYFWQQTLDFQNDEDEGLLDLTYDLIKHSSSKILKKICNISFIEARRKIQNINMVMRDKLKELRKPYGIVCFSELVDSDKMWKEYANNYQGICIEYSKKKLIKNQFHLVPVLYKRIKYINDYYKIDENHDGEIVINLIDEQAEKVFLTKTMKWEYEREWRHLDFIKNGNCITAVIPKKIYIGYNCLPDNRTRIIDYCKKSNIEFVIQEQL